MKTLKAAAVVAGSLALAGVAMPAVAADMATQGLVDSGRTVAGGVPEAAKVSAGYVGDNVKDMATGVKGSVEDSGLVKTPVVGNTVPKSALQSPVDSRLLGGLPLGKGK